MIHFVLDRAGQQSACPEGKWFAAVVPRGDLHLARPLDVRIDLRKAGGSLRVPSPVDPRE